MGQAVKGIDIIFHIAGQTSHVDSMTSPLEDVDINCRGNIVFLEACRKFNPDARIIYAGTRAQYGSQKHFPVKESQRDNPVDIYGADKSAAESYHMVYHRAYGLKTTSLRINNTYGPRHQMKHNKYGILNWFIRLALDNEKIKIFGDGRQKRDYNYVYNLGSRSSLEFRKLVEMVVTISGCGSFEFVPWDSERKKIETGDFFADTNKIQKDLAWKPRVSLKAGIEKTVEYYKKYKKHYWG
jgi:nucleoside-diphosphate-sugar epimerase